MNSALIKSLGSRWPNNVDSDDSEDDDVLPQEECWTLPDDGWTLVERPQVKSRGVRFKTNASNDARDGGILEERNYYDALENFVDDSAMLKYKRKERRNTNVRVEAAYERREVTVDVPLPMYVQPDRLPLSTRDDVTPFVSDKPDRSIGLPTVDTDGVNVGKGYMEQTLFDSEKDSVTIKERRVESWPMSSAVGQCIRKEEVDSKSNPAEQVLITETSKPMVSTQLLTLSQGCWTKGFVKLAEEAKLVVENSATFGVMEEDMQRSPEVTMPVAQTDLRNIPCKRIASAIMRLAEEALLVDVGLTTSEDMEEVGPQRCGFGEVIRRDISWRREDIVDRSIEFGLKEARRMPPSVVEEDRSLQWSIEECTDEVRGAYARESQMPSHGPVVREAELVFVATEFEVFIPVFVGEPVVTMAPLVVAEAVTTRVSALQTVGSDFQTGLSAAVDREDRCILGLDNTLNKVGHVAGQLSVSTVPVGDLLYFSAVCYVLPQVMRSLTVCTSTFFLSDDRGELPLPFWEREDRPVRISKIYVHVIDMRAQMTTKIHGVGPNGDRWDGIDVSSEWYMGRGWVKPRPGEKARVWPGNTWPAISGLESGPAVRTGLVGSMEDGRNEHPDRVDRLLICIKDAFITDGTLGQSPAVWQYMCVRYYIFSFLTAIGEMSSPCFLKSISEKDYDRLYDLPKGIHDVIGLKAVCPSSAVCKVMSVPDSNCVRVITPDEHVPTGFHEIIIEDMGLTEWPKVSMSDLGNLRLDWPQEFFTFVGRYQLELEQMRKECRDRFEGISSGACPTCEKFIQNNLGRHVAMFHLDLAQLWRCPVGWCPVWKGTSQDCIDHMRKAHNSPMTMKAGNLSRWFPPWTVTREQWHNFSRPSVSGIAIDTFLFSRIGISLLHRYRVFDRFGSHPAFRTPYMRNMFIFLKESDSETIRRSHRRRARELAAEMSQPASVDRKVMSMTVRSGPAPKGTVVSKRMDKTEDTLLVRPTAGTSGSSGMTRYGHSREEDTVQALMDLSLPRFTRLEDGRLPKTKLWPITEQPPSSPASVRDDSVTRTPSPCYQLDDLTSVSSEGGTTRIDYKLSLVTDSSLSVTPVGSIVSFSDDDLPLDYVDELGQEDTRRVETRDVRNDAPLGPTEVPEFIPVSAQTPMEEPICTPVDPDRPVGIPVNEDSPADDVMFDPMLGEWPIDTLSSPEDGAQKMAVGGKPSRPKPAAHPFSLVRKPPPKEMPSGMKPYGLRTRDKLVPKLKERPSNGLECEPLLDEGPSHSGAGDDLIGNKVVEDATSSARPADDELKTARSDKQPGKDTETTDISNDRRAPSITEVGQTQEDALGRSRCLPEDDFRTRMIGGGPDIGPVTIPGRQGGGTFSVSTPLLHQPPRPSEVPDWSEGEAMPLIIIEKSSLPPTPTKTMTGILIHPDDVLRVSPPMNSSGDPGVLSAPLSPNRVRQGHSQDMPAEGSLFAVSPDTPGYSMRPAGVVVQSAEVSEPPPPNYVGFNNPFFGTPIAFAQCQNTAGMDTTTTLPVYNIPRDCSVGVDQSSVPTIYASGVTPDSIPWSTAEDIIRDIAREGPFDPDTTPMDTEDSPLINTSMPGCPFRMTSYTGPAMVDSDTRYGLQLHHPRFLEFIGAPESARLLNQSPSFWVDRLGQASAMAAAMNLQRDAGFMMTNLQILEQFVMSLHRMSAEMLSIGVNHAVFPVDEVDRLSVMPRAQRAAKYMSAMGLWRPPSGVSAPGPLPVSTCTSCMNCESCFGRRGPSAQ